MDAQVIVLLKKVGHAIFQLYQQNVFQYAEMGNQEVKHAMTEIICKMMDA